MEVSRSPERLVLIAKAEGRKLEGLGTKEAAMEASVEVSELVRELVHTLTQRDLVDEYRLLVYPVIGNRKASL